MAFSRYLLVLAIVVLVATSNHHQAHALTSCVDVKAALSLPCDGCVGGVLGAFLLNTLLPTGQCCANVKNVYNQCLTAQLDIKTCLPLCNLTLVQLSIIFQTCGVPATI